MNRNRPAVLAPSGFASSAAARPWAAFALLSLAGTAQAAQFTINGPAGSGEFGRTVTTLANGNIVVTDPGFDAPGPVADVGAVYLYRPNGTLISVLRGSSANDRVGSGGVVALANGSYVVRSPEWDNAATPDVGAATFGSGAVGVGGVVSPANSLVGGTANDRVGNDGVTALANGNYVVVSTTWDNGAAVDAGAVTFGSGTSGVSGVVSPANSLGGSSAGDLVGSSGVAALANGNYVVGSSNWDNGVTTDAGAATFGSGATGINGVVSPVNSLVGSTAGDSVGAVVALANGNYVVRSPNWDNGAAANAGAATFGSGTSGISGVISPANSLVGSQASDRVGLFGIIALTNGNYVVRSPDWDNGPTLNAGAATFGSGASGVSGAVSPANSLVGSTAGDSVGSSSITPLASGGYVVASPGWDNGAVANAGAVTFGSSTSGISGVVTPANSLVGSTATDRIGSAGVTALSNGNYVVASPNWDNGAAVDAGAATFGSGVSGISGPVSPTNSLVGSSTGDRVAARAVTALSNGNYVVRSPDWDNGATTDAGAVTFGPGASGISGLVSPLNSLVGSAAADLVGAGVTALSNGNYVVMSPFWDNGAIGDAGAATFALGASGISGVLSQANSLVGSTPGDQVGLADAIALANGNYLVYSPEWDNGATANVGAATFGSGVSGISGVVSQANSLVGSSAGDLADVYNVVALANGNYVVATPNWDNGAVADAGAVTLGLSNGSVVGPITTTHGVLGIVANEGASQTFSYDPLRNQLAVGQPASNRVVLQRTGIATAISIVGDTPDPSVAGQPVTFTATVSASPNAPTDGVVTFTASTGETCVDTTPTATSASTADFSCTIAFTGNATSTVVAEYTGSITHAYSGSGPETHTTVVDPVFINGFETP